MGLRKLYAAHIEDQVVTTLYAWGFYFVWGVAWFLLTEGAENYYKGQDKFGREIINPFRHLRGETCLNI